MKNICFAIKQKIVKEFEYNIQINDECLFIWLESLKIFDKFKTVYSLGFFEYGKRVGNF